MARAPAKKIAFIASYPPRQCGIATFTSDLTKHIRGAGGRGFEPLVVAMQSNGSYQYSDPVKFEIRCNVKNDYISAADYINFSHVDVVSVQHEFGLFGGSAGSHLNLLLRRLSAPAITTMHTVLDEPERDYYRATVDLCELSHKIVVMNRRGITMLRDIYGVPEKKIQFIPHGIPDLPFVDSSYYKHKFAMEGRRTILTFGLLGRGKGIDNMLRAMPAIVAAEPSVLYIILGATHPDIIRSEGEQYRFSLKHMVKELGIQDNVIFHNRFVNEEELHNFLCAADIYVTPYQQRQQLTSGTLAYAVGTGKAVVSTPYWAAEELLADGRGKLVPFNSTQNMSDAIIDLLRNNTQFNTLRRMAYDFGRSMTWPVVGKMYWKMFNEKQLPPHIPGRTVTTTQAISILEVPEPPLDHLKRLTDDTGLIQHAKFTIPNREYGYCTDDNARAVVAMTKYFAQYAEPQALRLFDIYLSFIYHAQQSDGTINNLMSYDRRWVEDDPPHEALGRTLWAFGTVIAKPPLPRYLPIIKDCFDHSVRHVPALPIRGKAYAILGMADYLTQFPGASDIKRFLASAADDIAAHFRRTEGHDWHWFEDEFTYDNAILPLAMYVAGMAISEPKYIDVANKTAAFLLENTYDGSHFSFVGCNGWFRRGQKRARFDQQPIEVTTTVMMLRAAWDATGEKQFMRLQKKAFDWFLGENDLGTPVYDFKTKGCSDGLMQNGLNLNQGAESLVSFLISLLCILESYAATGVQREGPETPVADKVANITLNAVKDILAHKEMLAGDPSEAMVAEEIG
ncbi:MAG: glycosyltransferase family 4 protein [Phycisphaerae bacterium]|nr:glycosyltransferase family 4 protein [Phycisphaerae bacterium]